MKKVRQLLTCLCNVCERKHFSEGVFPNQGSREIPQGVGWGGLRTIYYTKKISFKYSIKKQYYNHFNWKFILNLLKHLEFFHKQGIRRSILTFLISLGVSQRFEKCQGSVPWCIKRSDKHFSKVCQILSCLHKMCKKNFWSIKNSNLSMGVFRKPDKLCQPKNYQSFLLNEKWSSQQKMCLKSELFYASPNQLKFQMLTQGQY